LRIERSKNREYTKRPGYLRAVLANVEVKNTSQYLGVLHVIIPKGRSSDKHYHSNFKEIFIPLTEGVIGVENQEFRVFPDEIIIVDEKEVHWAKALDDCDFRLIAIKVPDIPNDRVSVSDDDT